MLIKMKKLFCTLELDKRYVTLRGCEMKMQAVK